MRLSLLYTYYNNKRLMDIQLQNWNSYPRELKEDVDIIVVDDGSDPPLEVPECDLNLTVFRILEDIPWNQPGGRNLAAKYAQTEWMLVTDLDMVLLPSSCKAITEKSWKPEVVYNLKRVRMSTLKFYKPHTGTCLITKDNYWSVGGYDEDFCGHYGYDDTLFKKQFPKKNKALYTGSDITILEYDKFYLGNEYKGRTAKVNRKLLREKGRNPEYPKNPLRFKYQVVSRFKLSNLNSSYSKVLAGQEEK